MKKTIILIIIILVSSIFLYLFQREKQPGASFFSPESRTVFLGKKGFNLETAVTPSERELGLSGRKSLCSDCAMLFVFDKKGTYSFGMQDMQFDLDMLWIDGARIVQIDKNVSHSAGAAEIRRPDVSIDKVLELNAGESDRLGLKVGDIAVFK